MVGLYNKHLLNIKTMFESSGGPILDSVLLSIDNFSLGEHGQSCFSEKLINI